MIYKPSNATPSSEEIDVNDNNVFKTQVNTSGEPLLAYKFKIYSDDSKDVLYESSLNTLSTPVANKELLKFEVPSSQMTSNGVKNGKNYLWGIRGYNQLPSDTNQPNTLVCDGHLVGSTKYVVWSKISKDQEDTLNQIVYDRYIEFEVPKGDLKLNAKPTDEEKLKLKKIMDDTSKTTYRERLKITWVDKNLGTDENYVKIETEEPFTYNYNNGTSYRIYRTSDLHTVNSLFADPNSNVNVSDWVVVYKNINDATAAFKAGDTPELIKSSVIPALPAKKITGYSSDTGEMRVHDSWTKAPENGQVYRLFEYDNVAKSYKELFSSDLVQGAGKGARYYPTTVATGTNYYYRKFLNGYPSSGTVQKYYDSYSGGSFSGEHTLLDGESYSSDFVDSTHSTIQYVSYTPVNTSIKIYDTVIPTSVSAAIPYYYDSGATQQAGSLSNSRTEDIPVTLYNDSVSYITVDGFTRYIKNVSGETTYVASRTLYNTSIAANYAHIITGLSKTSSTKIQVRAIKTSGSTTKYAYTSTEWSTSGRVAIPSTGYTYCVYNSSDSCKVYINNAVMYVKMAETEMIDNWVLNSSINKSTSTKYVRTEPNPALTTTEACAITLQNSTCSTITINGVVYNIATPAPQTVQGADEFYAASNVTKDYGQITINSVSYYVPASDLTKRRGSEQIDNQYSLQLVGGSPIYNSLFVAQNNYVEGWGSLQARLLFMQPNINIKTDTNDAYGVPDEIVIPTSDGTSTMRINIVKQTKATDSVLGSRPADVTFNKLDDTQWLISGNALVPHDANKIPQILPQTDYSIYTAAMDTSPLNMFYARTKPTLTMKCRNTYVKTGLQAESYVDLKDANITGIFSYRIQSGKRYYSTIAKIGASYYSDAALTTRVGALSSNITAEPYLTYYTSSGSTYTIVKVSFRIKIGLNYYYVQGPTGGEGQGDITTGTAEYPVVRTITSSAPVTSGASREFASLIVAGVEQVVPILSAQSGTTYIDRFNNAYIHKFTSEEGENDNVVYVMQSSQAFIYARASLRSESRLIFYFKPPVYNYRDMEFHTDISYAANSEPVHPLVKYYKYTLYDSNGIELKNSGEVYDTDINWEFKGLDEGDNNDGYSSKMNKYTVKLLLVDEYNREFTKSTTFAVYYPIEVQTQPIELSFDEDEQAIQLVTKNPLYAITTDTEGKTTVTYQDISTINVTAGAKRGYVKINDNNKILNYDSVYRDELSTYPIEFSDDVQLTTQFRLSSDTMWQLYNKDGGADRDREAVVMRFGHKHPVESHQYSTNLIVYNSPEINAETFMNKVLSVFEFDNTQDARGDYNLIYRTAMMEWEVSKLSGFEYGYINPTTNRNQVLDLYGIALTITYGQQQEGQLKPGNGLHTRDTINVTVSNYGQAGESIVTDGGEFLDVSTHTETLSGAEVQVRNVRVSNFNATKFKAGVLQEFGEIHDGVYSLVYDSGNWKMFEFDSISSPLSMSTVGLTASNVSSKDYFIVRTSTTEGVQSMTAISKATINSNASITYDPSQTGFQFNDNKIYVIRCNINTGEQSNTCKICQCTYVLDYVKTYNILSQYGINLTWTNHGTTVDTDSFLCNQDYIGITLHAGGSTTNAWNIQNTSDFSGRTVSAATFRAAMKTLFNTQDVDDYYYIVTYINGGWEFKQVAKNEDTSYSVSTLDITEYGIQIVTTTGASTDKDFINIKLTTGEQLELRIVNPEYYSTGANNEIRCNGYASCFKLYDVTESNTGVLVPNCFYNKNTGIYESWYSIPEHVNTSTDYILRPLLNLALQPRGSSYYLITTEQEYINLVNTLPGPQQNTKYIITCDINVTSDYNHSSLTPGTYSYNSTATTDYPKGHIIKDASSMYIYVTDSTLLPIDNKTGVRVAAGDIAYPDTYVDNSPSAGVSTFYYSDAQGGQGGNSDNLWIDFSQQLDLTDISSFDTLWMFLYLKIDNSKSSNQSTITDPRIKCGLQLKEGGLIVYGK